MEVFDTELWAIRYALDAVMEKRDSLKMHAVKIVAVFGD